MERQAPTVTSTRLSLRETKRRQAGTLDAFKRGLDAEPLTPYERLRELARLRCVSARLGQGVLL